MSLRRDIDNHWLRDSTENLSIDISIGSITDTQRNLPTNVGEFYAALDIEPNVLRLAHENAKRRGTKIEDELIAERNISEEDFYRKLALRLGVPFVNHIDQRLIVGTNSIDILLKRSGPLRLARGEKVLTLITPSVSEAGKLCATLKNKPDLIPNFGVTTPSAIRKAVWQFGREERVKNTLRQLPETAPEMSAKFLMTNWQSFALGFFVAGFLALSAASASLFVTMLHTFLSLLYLSSNLLRLSACFFSPSELKSLEHEQDESQLPIYTILVALYREEALAKQLISALGRLNWPKSKLDIKLVCEEDDLATISALEAADPGPQFEIVKVPDSAPRTKPKALQYALNGARGEFVAVYDAEDIPNPDQLLEAFSKFSAADESFACFQAPLVISNAPKNWLTALFSIEYSGLFRRLIPLLSHFGLPIPLGGTSNHFRKSALEKVGGWDPCNVTEDADLGIRLYRHGYHTGVLNRPTLEHAPDDVNVWIKQRTRWLKGWMQSWLIFMRRPNCLFETKRPLGFFSLQIMIAGMLIAALIHPIAYLFVGYTVFVGVSQGAAAVANYDKFLFIIDSFNLMGSYFIFFLAGWSAFIPLEKRNIKKYWMLLLPIYWLMMSWAGWRAIRQLPTQAHKWEKTPHNPIQSKIISGG